MMKKGFFSFLIVNFLSQCFSVCINFISQIKYLYNFVIIFTRKKKKKLKLKWKTLTLIYRPLQVQCQIFQNFQIFCDQLHEIIGCEHEDCELKMYSGTLRAYFKKEGKTDDEKKDFLLLMVKSLHKILVQCRSFTKIKNIPLIL